MADRNAAFVDEIPARQRVFCAPATAMSEGR
jgi:hypothetical protein